MWTRNDRYSRIKGCSYVHLSSTDIIYYHFAKCYHESTTQYMETCACRCPQITVVTDHILKRMSVPILLSYYPPPSFFFFPFCTQCHGTGPSQDETSGYGTEERFSLNRLNRGCFDKSLIILSD